jgi:hypothetical protein
MKSIRPFLFFTLLLFTAAFAEAQDLPHAPGEMLVQFETDVEAKEILDNHRYYHGNETGIELGELLSKPMNIYRLHFDENAVSEKALLENLKREKGISNIQFNHYVEQRATTPNDPQIDAQWQHINDGSGGIEDADIDSDEAWDITTGGLTALGDTIVACVIEGGNLNHPDLIGNAWFNHQEIPDNDVDDDGNGYIDDYHGWNVQSDSDEGVYQGGHGTNVMGMIGATGDNELGVVGANWNVKIMSVSGENIGDEASVVEAYTYPLVQRQLYDNTDGEQGAFVVVTNASWGLDNGNPDDVPIWTAFYDTLGVYGILNCGATANNNVDIDEVGDIPTAAPSDYMISVTATNESDVRTFSGYGLETVDLGAPGEAIFTTAGESGYTNTSGTSFASPLTAGVVALLYSVPCPDFAQTVKDNPQLGADLVRTALFEGTDPVDNLADECVTGGRLNAFNSLQYLLSSCGDDFCFPPFGFGADLSNDTIYNFSWNQPDSSISTIRIRQLGDTVWSYIEQLETDTLLIDTLAYCANYEFQIASNCGETNLDSLNFGPSEMIETLGCCIAPDTVADAEINENNTLLSWDADFNIAQYEIYYRITGEDDWLLSGTSATGNYDVQELEECTFYDLLVKPACIEGFDVATEVSIRTKGCGHCIDAEFCASLSENSDFEFIDSVSIGSFANQSGNNGGYALFENTELELSQGQEVALHFTPEFPEQEYNEFFAVWIDLNQDGQFTEDERLAESDEESSEAYIDTITVPESAQLGNTRLRVAMKYIGFFNDPEVEACEEFAFGETEDYCIAITELVGIEDHSAVNNFKLYPNPGQKRFNLSIELASDGLNPQLSIYDLRGKKLEGFKVKNGTTSFDVNLAAGIYIYSLRSEKGDQLKTGKLVISQ